MISVLRNAQVFTPKSIGTVDVTYSKGQIEKIGNVNERALAQSGLEAEVMDLKGNILIPGIIDTHAHLLGGSGESRGFSTQTPELSLTELTSAGITTVVGTLGRDTSKCCGRRDHEAAAS